jgi:uncharacterized membrane protein
MLALRYLYVLALVVWLGGMVVLGALVAPTTFQVLEASEPVAGRELAGDVFGTAIARFHYVEYGAGGLMLLTLAGMGLLGPRPSGFAARAAILLVMLGLTVYSGLVVLGGIEGIQQEVGGLVSHLPAADARRIRFDALHALATQLMMATMVGGLALLYWEAREG